MHLDDSVLACVRVVLSPECLYTCVTCHSVGVGCEVVGPGVIEMMYRVEGTGDVQLTVRLFGEAVLVSVNLV